MPKKYIENKIHNENDVFHVKIEMVREKNELEQRQRRENTINFYPNSLLKTGTRTEPSDLQEHKKHL